jgi:hypothetical protein
MPHLQLLRWPQYHLYNVDLSRPFVRRNLSSNNLYTNPENCKLCRAATKMGRKLVVFMYELDGSTIA